MSRFYTLMHISPHYPLSRHFTSWLLPTPLLLAYRVLLCTYCITTLIVSNTVDTTALSNGQNFSYFTWLCYWGLTCYFIVTVIHSVYYVRTGRVWLESWPKGLQALHVLYYSTVVTFPFIVTIVFWSILYDGFPDRVTAWKNVSVHALNSVFAFLEILLPRTQPLPWLNLPFLIAILGGYLGVAYITHATQHFYTYDFLDPTRSGAGVTTAYCFGVLIGCCVVFSAVRGLVWVRRWFTEEKLGMVGRGVDDGSWGEELVEKA